MTKNKNQKYVSSQILSNGTMLELVLKENITKLCVFESKKVSYVDSYTDIGTENIYFPIESSNSLITSGAIHLPSEYVHYESKEILAGEVRQYIQQYVALNDEALEIAIAYVFLSYVYDAFEEIPYLRFLGDLGTGKTRALKIIGAIVNKGFFASGASTISPIFYTLDNFAPTLIFDEADLPFSSAANDLVKIFNNGTTKNMPVLRQVVASRKGEYMPKAFKVYGPKVIAMRKPFQDDGLESRFMTEKMKSFDLKQNCPISLPAIQKEEALRLRNKLLAYRFDYFHKVKINPDEKISSLGGRFNQMLLPLLAVSEEKSKEKIINFAISNNKYLQEIRQSTSLTPLVKDAYTFCFSKKSIVSVQEIASLVRGTAKDYGKPISNKLVASILRNELEVKTWKSNGNYVCGNDPMSPSPEKNES